MRRIPDKMGAPALKMFLIPARGGDPVPFQPEFSAAGESGGSAAVWSPDGMYVLYNGQKEGDPDSLDWWVAPVSGGAAVRTGAHRVLDLTQRWQVAYSWVGPYVYYASGTSVEGVNLFRVPIEPGSWRIEDPGQRITSGAGIQFWASALRDGRIVYAHTNWSANIWTLPARPDEGMVAGTPSIVDMDLKAKFDLGLSRDGGMIVYSAFGGLRGTLPEVRRKDLATGEERVIPMRAAQWGQRPRLSPDGTALSYRDAVDGKVKAFVVTGRDAVGREVCQDCVVEGFYSDPRFALVREESGGRIAKLNIATGEKTTVLEAAAARFADPVLSPDDRWLAFIHEKPAARAALRIARLGADGRAAPESEWILLEESDRYLASPSWSPAGNYVYYLSERDGNCCVWARRLDPGSKTPLGEAVGAYHAHQARFQLNYPSGFGALAVARDKIAFWMSEGTGNIYLATPKKRR